MPVVFERDEARQRDTGDRGLLYAFGLLGLAVVRPLWLDEVIQFWGTCGGDWKQVGHFQAHAVAGDVAKEDSDLRCIRLQTRQQPSRLINGKALLPASL